MEEMNKEIVENTVTEMVEATADKLTFKENVIAYGVATVFGIGIVTSCYLGYKGSKALAKKIKERREKSKETEDCADVVTEYEEYEYPSEQE